MIKEDAEREERILMEIVVDCYHKTERAMGWYYYLEENLKFPFQAQCIAARSISPLRKGERVDVLKMGPEDECEKEMFVTIRWQGRNLAVPLAQLEGVTVDDKTGEALQDWRYWLKRGYEF
jgi:hypothetical protein